MIIYVKDSLGLLDYQILIVKLLVMLLNVSLYLFVCLIYFHRRKLINDNDPVRIWGVFFLGDNKMDAWGWSIYIMGASIRHQKVPRPSNG